MIEKEVDLREEDAQMDRRTKKPAAKKTVSCILV